MYTMKKNCMPVLFLGLLFIFALLFRATPAFAEINISLNDSDVTLSKEEPFAGDTVKIFARLNNLGDADVLGYVIFTDNNKQIGEPQSISIRQNTYDDVFVDWKVTAGEHKIETSVFDFNTDDQSPRKDKVLQKNYSIDSDSDADGIGDKIDSDDDNDGILDEQEIKLGINPLKADTDGDSVIDKADVFPLDKTEWRDTNNNGIGDNKDTDADGDGINNEDETKIYGTNPSSQDSDSDGVSDNQEIKNTTNPNKKDTDGDGVIDSEDAFPLDASKWQAGFLGSVMAFFKGREYLYFVFGIPTLLILYFLFRKKKRRR